MVCFDIHLAFEVHQRSVVNDQNLRRIHHLAKHCLGTLETISYEKGFAFCNIHLCDEDAVAFLRDVPQPVFVTTIKMLRSPVLFYSFYKWSGTEVRAPKLLLLKNVFWMAKSLESRFTPASRNSAYG
jgi:hypothetical protein